MEETPIVVDPTPIPIGQEGNIEVMSPEAMHREDPFSLEALAASNRAHTSGAVPITARGRQERNSTDSEVRPSSLPTSAHFSHSPQAFSPRGAMSPAGRGRGFSPAPGGRRSSQLSRSSSLPRRRTLTRTDSGREFWNLPEQPRRPTLVDLAEDSSESEAEDADEWGGPELPLIGRRVSPPGPWARRAWRRTREALISAWWSFYGFMTVPTWAALVSIIIAMIPPLQHFVSGVRPFVAAVKSAGQCSIPVTLVVLGAFFYTPPPAIQLPTAEHDHTIKGYFERKIRGLKNSANGNGNAPESKQYEGENRAVFVAVVSRMIIVPLLFLPIIALIARYDYFPAAADPVFILCSVLLVSSPPALTLAQITQAASGDAFERLISKTISWSYAVLTPPLTLVYVVIGLVFSRL